MALPLPDDVVFLTGASTGLGLALARRLLRDTEHRLVLTARPSSLPRFAEAGLADGERVRVLPLDVRDDGERAAVVRRVEAEWGPIGVLVNNAGVAYRSVVEHLDEAERIAQMHVNFRAPVALAGLVLPGMRAQRRGRIVNVSSVGGMMAMPTMAAYSASKFALEGASEALWYEVRPWGVHVTLVQPGFIHSESFERTLYTRRSRLSEDDHFDPYHPHYQHMSGFIGRLMRATWATPDSVAARIAASLRDPSPPLRLPATWDAHVFSWVRRLLPRGLYHELLYRMLPGVRSWGPAWERLAPAEPIPRDEDEATLEVPMGAAAPPISPSEARV